MSGPSVLVLASEPETYAAPIRARFEEVSIQTCASYRDLADVLARHEPTVVLASKIGPAAFPREELVGHPSVEWIQCTSAGVDHLLPLSSRVRVTSASGIHDDALADYVVCAVLMFNLHFPAFFRQQLARRWRPRELVTARGQKLVVLGYGSIGQAVAARARALGMRVVGVRSRPRGDDEAGVERLTEVLADADALAVTLPRTPSTLGLVGRDVLRSMKPGSILVNISRGGIVDEPALVEALESGRLAGAVVDVFDTEPLPRESPLWDLENVVITPHTGDIHGWQQKVVELFCANLERFRAGEPLVNLVDPSRGY